MIKTPFQIIVSAFWLLVFTELVAVQFGFSWLQNIVKPLLMPALVILLLHAGKKATGKKIILAALFFSWLGDVFLLFESLNAYFFIAGLASFFITHACYIIYFLSIRSASPSLLIMQPLYLLLILCYGMGLVWLLFPHLGDLKIPVILYAAVICGMLLCSIHIYSKIPLPANRYFLSGALLFILSDSILAVNKFYQPLTLAGILIMLSYCAAQYFIVSGVVNKRFIAK